MDTGARISLALTIHNHQPVGNFGWVLADVYEQAYRPLIDLLERHPRIRVSLHYSGPLLEWLRANRPESIERIRGLLARGQVEVVGGGWFEPILVALPERDRIEQLRRMSDELSTTFGRRPRGAWLAERVWEPSLPSTLRDGGYDWTIVDDAHLRAASIPDSEHWGAWTTDDQGRRLTVFPTEQGLRYLIPFQSVDEVIDHLRDHATPAGTVLGTMGDDGEKFGSWPTTFEHCWGRTQWMERFFQALEANADWLTTTTPSDWLDAHAPVGRVYIPTSSYVEMTEWALPPRDAIDFSRELHLALDEHRPYARFLRGGFWRNYQRRYREINALHKQMLRASDKVAAMPDGALRRLAVDHLGRGQSNDCYWHGLFGGIYISHMRLATFEHLVAAEDLADDAPSRPGTTGRLADVDVDGVPEVLFEAPGQVVVVKLDAGAAIDAWDIRPAHHALAAVLRRRPEASHERLLQAARAGTLRATGDPAPIPAGADDAVESIHEIVAAKEPGLAGLLVYDGYERRSGLVHVLDGAVSPQAFIEGRFENLADALDEPYTLESLTTDAVTAVRRVTVRTPTGTVPATIRKTITLGGGRRSPTLAVTVEIANAGDGPIDARIGVEFSLTFLGGGHNPAAWYEVDGHRTPHDTAGSLAGTTGIASGNTDLGITLRTTLAPAGDTWWAPIDTISNSESGFERVYQGSSLLLSWPLRLGAGERAAFQVRHALETARDMTAEDVDRMMAG